MEPVPYPFDIFSYGTQPEHLWFKKTTTPPMPFQPPPMPMPTAAPMPFPVATPPGNGGGQNTEGYAGIGARGLAGRSSEFGAPASMNIDAGKALGGLNFASGFIPGPAGMALGFGSKFAQSMARGVDPMESVGRALISAVPMVGLLNMLGVLDLESSLFGLTPEAAAKADEATTGYFGSFDEDTAAAQYDQDMADMNISALMAQAAATDAAYAGYVGPGFVAGPMTEGGPPVGNLDSTGRPGDAPGGAAYGNSSGENSSSGLGLGFGLGLSSEAAGAGLSSGSGYQGGNAGESGGGSGGAGAGGSSVICTALRNRRFVGAKWCDLTHQWGARHPKVLRWYHSWAKPIAALMDASLLASIVAFPFAMPIIATLSIWETIYERCSKRRIS